MFLHTLRKSITPENRYGSTKELQQTLYQFRPSVSDWYSALVSRDMNCEQQPCLIYTLEYSVFSSLSFLETMLKEQKEHHQKMLIQPSSLTVFFLTQKLSQVSLTITCMIISKYFNQHLKKTLYKTHQIIFQRTDIKPCFPCNSSIV